MSDARLRLVTVHGIGRPPADFPAALEAHLQQAGLVFEPRRIWWQPVSPLPSWAPLPLEWLADLWLSWTWFFRRRRARVLGEIREAAGDGRAVIVAHSWGVWLAFKALRRGPVVALFVSLDRAVHRLYGLFLPGHHEVRFGKWINVYSTVLGASVPVAHFSAVCPDIRNVPIPHHELSHGGYWASPRVAEIIRFHWPRAAAGAA